MAVAMLGAQTAWAGSLLGASATLADIEACVSRNLPEAAGVIEFSVDAIDRSGVGIQSRAELRWRKPANEPTRILLVVSEPAQTAGTALLIIDRDADGPEFFVRLPEMKKVRRIRSRRLRGPVLGTDFSYEDLQRFREPLDKTLLDLIGTAEVEGQPAWLLETVLDEDDGSDYSRVLTYVDQKSCLPVRIALYESGANGTDRLRKQLDAPLAKIRSAAEGAHTTYLPYEFVMRDLRRKTRTVVRIDRFEVNSELPVEQFTQAALQDADPSPLAALEP
jgi:hypothetical protein